MALDFNKIEEPDDSVFPVKFEDESNLDMYGVWVKKRPENKESDILPIENDTAEDPFENDILEFDDHDVVNLDNSDDVPLEFDELTTSNNFETTEPEASEGIIEDESITFEDDIYGDEFDIFDKSNAAVIDEEEKYSFDTDLDEMPKDNKDEAVSDINDFETLDLDDFLDDDETLESSSKKETEKKDENGSSEPDNNIKLDLSFDEDYLETKESDAIDFEGNDSFEITVDEPEPNETLQEEKFSDVENLQGRTIEDISDFDDILDELETKNEPKEEKAEELTEDVPFNITIDEYSDITSLAGEAMGNDDELEDVEIFSDISEFEEVENIKDSTADEKQENDDLVIESTIIEAGNIEEIRKENQKIMDESSPVETEGAGEADDFDSMLDSVMNVETETAEREKTIEEKNDIFFDDIGALENDLLDSANDDITGEFIETSQEIQSNKKADEIQSSETQSNVIANDKATEILTQIASELVNIKNELANMKSEMAQTQQKLEESTILESKENKVNSGSIKDANDSDKSGFFNDDDGDETIALTGDELNNILITADFTEENTEKEYEIPETLDKIDGAFLDDSEEENADEKDEIFADEDILNDVEPEHINDLKEDISYLDEDSIDEDIIQEDFITNEITDDLVFEEEILDTSAKQDTDTTEENNTIEDFDLKITELELPDGQSIPLGDEYSGFNAITDNIEEGHDEASDFEDLKFDENLEQEEVEPSDEIQSDEIAWEDSTSTVNMDDNEDSVFSAEELDQTAQDIPRLELDESAAEEQKIQTETLPIHLKDEIKSVLTYMDQLLESLPEEKIEEFAKSEYFDTYKRLFDELGIS
nr:hypothetical protein [uncultured Treponema sp.]